jgi:hypothetical protein
MSRSRHSASSVRKKTFEQTTLIPSEASAFVDLVRKFAILPSASHGRSGDLGCWFGQLD